MIFRSPRIQITRWIPALFWMFLIFFLSSRQTLPSPPGVSFDFAAVAGHFAVYFVLTLCYIFALEEFIDDDQRLFFVVLAGAALYGLSDEVHQSFVPGRNATVYDLAIDVIGSLFAAWFWHTAGRRLANRLGI